MGEEAVADRDIGIEDDVGEDHGVVANSNVIGDDSVGANVGVGAYFGGGSNGGCGVDSGRVGGRTVEDFDGAGEGEVGVGQAERGGGDLGESAFYKDGSGLSGVREFCVARVRDEGYVSGSGLLDAGDSCDEGRWIAAEFRTKALGQIGQGDAEWGFLRHGKDCSGNVGISTGREDESASDGHLER